MSKSKLASFYWKDVFKRFLINKGDRFEFLKSSLFFHGFSDSQISLTEEFLHVRQYVKDSFVFEKGQPGAALYFIESGSVSIEVAGENNFVVHLATLNPGDFFGELALVDDEPRSATARCETETKLLALSRSELDRMFKESPTLGGLVFRSLAQITSARLKATIENIPRNEAKVKMVGNG